MWYRHSWSKPHSFFPNYILIRDDVELCSSERGRKKKKMDGGTCRKWRRGRGKKQKQAKVAFSCVEQPVSCVVAVMTCKRIKRRVSRTDGLFEHLSLVRWMERSSACAFLWWIDLQPQLSGHLRKAYIVALLSLTTFQKCFRNMFFCSTFGPLYHLLLFWVPTVWVSTNWSKTTIPYSYVKKGKTKQKNS